MKDLSVAFEIYAEYSKFKNLTIVGLFDSSVTKDTKKMN